MLYSFYDYQRTTPILLLTLLFVAAVVLLGRWRGVGAVGGLIASLGVLLLFVLPALLRWHDAGIVIGSLGVLDDVTVTQVSAVWELRRAQPEASTEQLYSSALRIGRDHISSTVNTLFLAYAGASLPLLPLFTEASEGIGTIATREIVAVEIVRALVGSIGLVSAVPISTWLAAVVLTEVDDSRPNAV